MVVSSPTSTLSASDLSAVLQLVQSLAHPTDLSELTLLMRTAVRELLSADGATFVLREGDQVFYADEDAIAPLWKGQRFPIEGCISGWAVQHREIVCIEDVRHDPRIPQQLYEQTFVRSLVIAPIRTIDPIGALGAYWATEHKLTERELTLLAVLSDSAAVAFDRIRLIAGERAARERAEQANQLQTDLLSIVSHDIRNPLWAITMAAATLERTVPETDRSMLRSVHAIQGASRRIGSLAKDLLDCAQVEAGALMLQPAPVAVNLLLNDVREFDAVAGEKGCFLAVFEADSELAVLCDRERTAQVLANLVSNALKFSEAQCIVHVRAERVDDAVRFSVRDEGPGVPEALRPRIFQRFARSAIGNSGQGNGLGLFIARGLVLAQGGEIGFESEVGKGSTFFFTLPLAPVSPSDGDAQ